ncbi:MAG: hypothetical protein AB9872_01455 [Solidesulfovibrio sp.]
MKRKSFLTAEGLISIYTHHVVHLSDLLLRWSRKPHVKILKKIIDGRLQLFLIINTSVDEDNKIRYEIAEYSTEWLVHKKLCNGFSKFVLLLEQVEKIERKNSEYISKKLNRTRNCFETCTIKNINMYAPQFAYVLCKYSALTHFDTATELEICIEIEQINITINNCIAGSRESWILPNSIIWHESSTYRDIQKRTKICKNIQTVKCFVEQQNSIGITSKVHLTILIDDTFPYLLTDRELGGLLPAREGVIVGPDAQRKQGQRLRKKAREINMLKYDVPLNLSH